MRFTEQDLAKFQANSGRVVKAQKTINALTKPRKYSNKPTIVDGIRFDSKLEARRYGELKLLKAAGQVEWFLMQVPIHCGGGVIFRCDFQIKWRTTLLVAPRITFEDTHGSDTKAKTNKLKQVKALHGIDVELVKAAG